MFHIRQQLTAEWEWNSTILAVMYILYSMIIRKRL